jgi:hypothetical protein
MGVESALRTWKPLLRPDGRLALSEAVWFSCNPLAKPFHNWSDYPAMADVHPWKDVARANGYELLGDFRAPGRGLLGCYTPMKNSV